ncbi:hypothetical protein Tco_0378532 [Tanacetum coccineum]
MRLLWGREGFRGLHDILSYLEPPPLRIGFCWSYYGSAGSYPFCWTIGFCWSYYGSANRIAYLGRERGSEDFTDILSYLDHSPLRFLQMLVAIETADRTPRPTSGFTRKLFSNMKLKWEGEEIPLTPPMLAIAVAGNDAANEHNVATDEAAGSAAEAHPVPHSPPVSPVRDPSPERQSASERPPSLSPTPPAQTSRLAEPLVFGPAPRPAGYVDPDVLEPIIFGPQPRPYDFVDPALEEPVIFGPPPRPDNYIEPEDIDNLVSIPAGPNDAPTPTADAAGRAEDPTLLTSLSKLDMVIWGRIDSLETELGTSKKIMGGAILTLVSRVKKLERTDYSSYASKALGHDQAVVPSVDMEEREEEEVPLRRKRSVYRRARTEFHTPAFAQFQTPLSAAVLSPAAVSESADPSVVADKGKAHMPDLDIPAEFVAEDAQARQRFEEEQASERLVQRLQAEDLAQEYMPNKQWLNLMLQVGSNPALARELLGTDVTEENFVERMTAIKDKKKRALADLRYRALKGKPIKQSECQGRGLNKQLIEEYENICRRLEKDRLLSALYKSIRPACAILSLLLKGQRVARASSQILLFLLILCMALLLPFAGGVFCCSWSLLSYFICNGFAGFNTVFNEFFLDSDEDEQIGMSRVAADLTRMTKLKLDSALCLFSSRTRRNIVSEKDDYLWDTPVEIFSDVDVGLDSGGDVQSVVVCPFILLDVEDFWREHKLNGLLTVPPSYCRDVVVAGNVIQTVQAGLRESYECLASVPIACTARQMVFSSPWLTAKKESGSPLQTDLLCKRKKKRSELQKSKRLKRLLKIPICDDEDEGPIPVQSPVFITMEPPLKDNPVPSSVVVTKSTSTFPNLFLEETNTFDNSFPESETFSFNLEEISSGSPTTHSELSLPDYKAFYIDNDHFKEKSSGSTTTHVDFSQYDSFIFDLSNDQFPPADRSDFYHEEFADELAQIISQPEYDCFFKDEPELGNFTMDVEVDINKKTENQAKMTKLSMEWKRLCKIKAKSKMSKSESNTEESAVKPEPESGRILLDAILTHLMGRESPTV